MNNITFDIEEIAINLTSPLSLLRHLYPSAENIQRCHFYIPQPHVTFVDGGTGKSGLGDAFLISLN